MKKYGKYWLLLGIFFALFFFSPKIVEAGILKFDTTTVNTNVDSTFDVQVVVDAASDEINSIDAYINYNSTLLQAQSVSAGSYFPSIAQNLTTGRVYIAGYVDDPATSKTGTGTVATITFKALQEGTVTLSYFCDTSVNESSKIIKNDINATNVIDCSSNGSTTVTIAAAGGSGTGTPTPTPTSTNGSGGTSDVTVTELPRAGTLDNLISISVPGLVLLTVGILFKFL